MCAFDKKHLGPGALRAENHRDGGALPTPFVDAAGLVAGKYVPDGFKRGHDGEG